MLGEIASGIAIFTTIVGLIAWLRKLIKDTRDKAKAQFKLSWTVKGNAERLKIENTSQTATAKNVMLYLEGVPYTECRARVKGETIHSIYPPLHCQILMFGWSFDAPAPDEVYVEWADKSGKHKTPPVPFHALPKY